MKNVILLTLDATRQDVFGIYGNNRGLTPFIDSLEQRAMVFNKAQSTGPYTQASFPGIMTSSHYLDYGKPAGLAPQRTLVSEVLKKAGIKTAAFHSNPYCSGHFGWNRGWDHFYDSMQDEVDPRIPYIRGPEINKKVFAWLSSLGETTRDTSMFLWVHYMDIHEPYMPAKKYTDLVEPALNTGEEEMYSLFENTLLKRDTSDPGKVEMLKTLYDCHVREVDSYVEELLTAMTGFGLAEDTAVIITSDHGDEFNEHGGLSHDNKMYGELIEVPLLIYGTGSTGRCNRVVSTVDIAPTIVDLFDLEQVSSFKGETLTQPEKYSAEGVFGEGIDQKSKRGGDIDRDKYFYREEDLKVIYSRQDDHWEMYDLSSDSKETDNIAQESANFQRLKNKLLPMVRRWE